MVRRTPDGRFESLPLVRNEDGTYEGMLFDLTAPLDYYVDADGVQSASLTLKVVDVPYVQKLELEYHFPAYTGLEPQKIEDGGDIAVLRGTEVRVHIMPTMKTPGGQIALNDKQSVALTPQRRRHARRRRSWPTRDGFYRVELDAPTGERVAASPQYTIDVLADQPPTVSFTQAGPRYVGVADRRGVRRGERRGRLRRQGSRARLLGQRRTPRRS